MTRRLLPPQHHTHRYRSRPIRPYQRHTVIEGLGAGCVSLTSVFRTRLPLTVRSSPSSRLRPGHHGQDRMAIITALQNWDPLRIDALGIVTLLGADQVSYAFGRLANDRYGSLLPTVGAYVFAANSFTTPIPGFQVYNIDDKIYTTDVPGWFARWLLSQDVKTNATKYTVTYVPDSPRPPHASFWTTFAIILGILAHAPTVILSALTWDWWGLANSICMASSTLSRFILVQLNKRALDRNAENGQMWLDGTTMKKSFWILPTGDAITIRAPKGLLVNCLLTNPRTAGPLRLLTEAAGWVAFGGFAVTLGMSTLFIQLLTVVILLACTCMVVWHVGDEDCEIGVRMKIGLQEDADDTDTRAEAYFKLDLSPEQEEALMHWSLFPLKTNKGWWSCYEHCKSKGPNGFRNWRVVQDNYARYGSPEPPPAPPKSS